MFNIYLLMIAGDKTEEFKGWTLSKKKNKNGHYYYYIQFSGGQPEKYVKRKEEAEVLAKHKEKMFWRQVKRDLLAELAALPPAERREIRQQMRLYKEMKLEELPKDKDIAPDGTIMASRQEIMEYELYHIFGIFPEYDKPIDPENPWSYRPDFTVKVDGRTKYIEHMGMLSDRDYRERQIRKLRAYHRSHIRLEDNLTITVPMKDGHMNIPRILWRLVRGGIIQARKVRKLYYKKD